MKLLTNSSEIGIFTLTLFADSVFSDINDSLRGLIHSEGCVSEK